MSLEVPGGSYDRTYVNLGRGATGESDPAVVTGFRLDKYLVTVGRFRQFVSAVLPPDGGEGWLPSPGSGKHAHLNGGSGLNATAGGYEPGWVAADDSNIAPTDENLACFQGSSSWTSSPGAQDTLPINCVNWYEAYAFCIWDGGFLPSEAEWEYAAAGGSQQREYPWGSTDPGTSSQYAVYDCYYPSGVACTDLSNTSMVPVYIAPVGTTVLGAGAWGQLDLAGEVSEWTLDWYAAYADPCTDCVDITVSESGTSRGGFFIETRSALLPPNRGLNSFRSEHSDNQGFRCARTP
jgi:formylglycine-generating enzyme